MSLPEKTVCTVACYPLQMLDVDGDYMKSDVYYLLPKCHARIQKSQNKVLGISLLHKSRQNRNQLHGRCVAVLRKLHKIAFVFFFP